MVSTRYEVAGKKFARAVQILDFVDDVLVHALKVAGDMQRENNGLAVDALNFEEWMSSGGSHGDSPYVEFKELTTWDANHRGGETYRVGVTGQHRTRRILRCPCTPHHNLDVAMLMIRKNRMSAVMLYIEFQDANPDTRFIRCRSSVTSRN